MEENNVNIAEPMSNMGGLPAQVSAWTKIRQFLCKEITVELTPKQEKVFKEVYDFWHYDITGEDVKKVLFHEITWQSTKKFWTKKIEITL